MKTVSILVVLFMSFSAEAFAENVKIGNYSGKPGFFVQLGNSPEITLDAILMNEEVVIELGKLKFTKLGETKTCEVSGVQQSFGMTISYSIFKVRGCR